MQPKTKILVVDDEEALRTSIRMILEHHGFTVTLAPNVPEALQIMDLECFDVLLSDLRMPGPGDGLTVIHAMKERSPKTVTLLMSGNLNPSSDGMGLAADELLRKPLQMRSVIELIQRKLETVAGLTT